MGTFYNSSVAEGTGYGLYFYGSASEVKPEDTELAMHLLFKRAEKNLNRVPEDYLGSSPRRIYQFVPQSAWITGDRLSIGNQLVDTKIKVYLKNQSYALEQTVPTRV